MAERKRLFYSIVLEVLEDIPETRSNDDLLFAELLRRHDTALPADDRETVCDCFSDWRSHIKYDTIRRTRQKLQEEHPNLRPLERVLRGRSKKAEIIQEEIKGYGKETL